ncbi:hypothetical protein BJ912DRAFT_1047152 [Pholiota molesta]|nr:hypothetical protein BJ912DRAFT_1047152 [Pholiota molesta]
MHFGRHSIADADLVSSSANAKEGHHSILSNSCDSDCGLCLVEGHESTQNADHALENNLYWCIENSPKTYASSTSQWANLPEVNTSTQKYSLETYEGPTLPPDIISHAVPNQYLITPWNAISNSRVIYPYGREDYHQSEPETNMVLTNMNPAEMPVTGILAPEWHLGWGTNSLPPFTSTVSPASRQAGQHGNEVDAYIVENVEMNLPSHLLGGSSAVQEYNIGPNVASEKNFDGNLQHRFLDFVMKNRVLLGLVTLSSNSVEGIWAIQQAFEADLIRQGLTPPLVDISKIFLCFRPVIGSVLGRQEKETRRMRKPKLGLEATRRKLFECIIAEWVKVKKRAEELESSQIRLDYIRSVARWCCVPRKKPSSNDRDHAAEVTRRSNTVSVDLHEPDAPTFTAHAPETRSEHKTQGAAEYVEPTCQNPKAPSIGGISAPFA